MRARGLTREAGHRTPVWPGRIFLDAGTILYLGPGSVADVHAHHAVQFVWSREAGVRLELQGRSVERRAVLVPANEPHALIAPDRQLALLLVESHGARGKQLDRLARRDIGRELVDELSTVGFPTPALSRSEAADWCSTVLRSLGTEPGRGELSSVSRRAVAYIERSLAAVPRLGDAAAKVGVSPTRLTHVFTREVGIPFRRFVLWARIKRAVSVFQQGDDLTGSAVSAGFNDAAHFSRTFRSMFGLSPSMVLPVAEVIGTIWPGSE